MTKLTSTVSADRPLRRRGRIITFGRCLVRADGRAIGHGTSVQIGLLHRITRGAFHRFPGGQRFAGQDSSEVRSIRQHDIGEVATSGVGHFDLVMQDFARGSKGCLVHFIGNRNFRFSAV